MKKSEQIDWQEAEWLIEALNHYIEFLRRDLFYGSHTEEHEWQIRHKIESAGNMIDRLYKLQPRQELRKFTKLNKWYDQHPT